MINSVPLIVHVVGSSVSKLSRHHYCSLLVAELYKVVLSMNIH